MNARNGVCIFRGSAAPVTTDFQTQSRSQLALTHTLAVRSCVENCELRFGLFFLLLFRLSLWANRNALGVYRYDLIFLCCVRRLHRQQSLCLVLLRLSFSRLRARARVAAHFSEQIELRVRHRIDREMRDENMKTKRRARMRLLCAQAHHTESELSVAANTNETNDEMEYFFPFRFTWCHRLLSSSFVLSVISLLSSHSFAVDISFRCRTDPLRSFSNRSVSTTHRNPFLSEPIRWRSEHGKEAKKRES